MTLANAPLWLETARVSATDLPDGASEIFLRKGLDGQMTDLPVGQRPALVRSPGAHSPNVHWDIPESAGPSRGSACLDWRTSQSTTVTSEKCHYRRSELREAVNRFVEHCLSEA